MTIIILVILCFIISFYIHYKQDQDFVESMELFLVSLLVFIGFVIYGIYHFLRYAAFARITLEDILLLSGFKKTFLEQNFDLIGIG